MTETPYVSVLGLSGNQQRRLPCFCRTACLQYQGLMQNHTSSLLCFIPGWKYSSGLVTADMIKEHLPPPGEGTLILVCGPPRMIQEAVHPSLEQLGYTKDMIFTY